MLLEPVGVCSRAVLESFSGVHHHMAARGLFMETKRWGNDQVESRTAPDPRKDLFPGPSKFPTKGGERGPHGNSQANNSFGTCVQLSLVDEGLDWRR